MWHVTYYEVIRKRQKKSVSRVLSLLLIVVIAIAIISGRNPVISLIL